MFLENLKPELLINIEISELKRDNSNPLITELTRNNSVISNYFTQTDKLSALRVIFRVSKANNKTTEVEILIKIS